mgnify:CR=1 FL=1
MFHFGEYGFEEIVGEGILFIQVCLEILVGYFVAFLKTTVVWQIFLDSIVGKVDACESVLKSVLCG